MKKIIIAFLISVSIFGVSFAGLSNYKTDNDADGIIDLSTSDMGKIRTTSINLEQENKGDIVSSTNKLGTKVFEIFTVIVSGVLLIWVVYIGIMMIMSMGSNEEEVTSAKRQLRYVLVALLFINIPDTLYEAFQPRPMDEAKNIIINENTDAWSSSVERQNLIVNPLSFGYTLNDKIIGFLKVTIFAIAVTVLLYEGIKLLTARGREDRLKEVKGKILYSVLALIFIGVMEAWKRVAFSGSIDEGKNIFDSLANLALYFAGPTAIFFLLLGGYYLVTAAGDDEKLKKAKSIILNTLLAVFILLASYTFLLDLAKL